jgi:hypothetical protein
MMSREILEKLNQETFDAEIKAEIGDKDWEVFLRETLADEFKIRRARKDVADQSKEQMIKWIKDGSVGDRREPWDVQVWCDQSLGVVTCLVTMKGADGEWHTYQNIKVFRKQGEVWQCVYWQVTEAPL